MTQFAGDKKEGLSFFGKIEKKLVEKYTDKIPKFIETYHLTYTTILWCIGILFFCGLASKTGNNNWLWGTSLMIIFQYITDLFDGAVGRKRQTGLIKWGFYMDHFLDYVFLCCIVIGYAFIIPKIVTDASINAEIMVSGIKTHFFTIPIEINYYYFMFYVLMFFGAFMVNSFLSFAATNKFKISYMGIGPTEIRLLFIVINTFIIFFGKTYMVWALPYILVLSFIGLITVVYKTQKILWEIDMEEKNNQINND